MVFNLIGDLKASSALKSVEVIWGLHEVFESEHLADSIQELSTWDKIETCVCFIDENKS